MANSGFKVLDSDMHILEPADLWQRYIEKRFKHLRAYRHHRPCARPAPDRSGRQSLGPARRPAAGNNSAARAYFS